jgi:hypothetical protein
MANKILAGDAPFTPGMGVGVGIMGVSAAYQPLEGLIASVETVTEENKTKIAGKLGWGTAGMVAFGPVGALAGLILGGRRKEVCFACYLKDGRKFLAIADAEIYQKFVAAAMTSHRPVAPIDQSQVQYIDDFSTLPKWGQGLSCLFILAAIAFLWWIYNQAVYG